MKIFVLYVHRQYKLREIVRELEISQTTVKNHLRMLKQVSPIIARMIRMQTNENWIDGQRLRHENEKIFGGM
ncbi:ArsR family transcriptional regulator [Paenibacillus cymbidii]|uniref:ArsR family transcriptional regulator n=1 Tax=Paenibacillus cymbidii TaxID=1639034 RepID=UPI0038B24883